jgi:DNA repair exonuclease SbcCD nuclease subunit
MILFSDVHLCEDSEETVFGQVLPGILEATKEHNDREVACLGDLLHFRYKIDARIQNQLRETFRLWYEAGIRLRILPGNHDQYNVEGRNALEVLGEIEGVCVHTNPTWDKDGLWIPYRKEIESVSEAISVRPSSNVVFMHHGVRGSYMNDGVRDTSGVDPQVLGKFKVFCGHYHKRQDLGNIHYIGSPYQTKADESGQDKGYSVWDGKTLTHVTKDWGKKYHRFELSPGDVLDLSRVRPGDEVRVKTVGEGASVRAEQVGQQLAQSGISNHVVTPEIEAMQSRLSVEENSDLKQYAKAYVDQVETDLDKKRLMAVFGELVP